MATDTQSPTGHPDSDLRLSGQRLPRWAVPATAAGSVVLTLAVFALTPLQGRADFLVAVGIVFLLGQTAASFLVEGRRHAVDRLATNVVYTCFVLAIIPLVAVIVTVLVHGLKVVNLTFLTHSQRNIGPTDTGGGVYHAIIGTLEIAFVTSLISIPIAVLVAVYLVEYGGRGLLARLVTFFVDVMTGIPSIVAGLFIYVVWILTLGFQRSGFPACLALAILMIPVVVRSTEEMLKLVPNELRESSLALGVPKWRTILRVVIPTALPGIITGIMLGVARVAGETAPLLLLTGYTQSINFNLFSGPMAALPTLIFDQAGRPSQSAVDRAWGAALVLIVIVMLLNLVARVIARLTRVR
ncbi:MAG TPA: phosphate ABC transporter permease PstA [Actinomycetes bacterium]|nr:phosphate ABC transporter permease PstA [Actinomycetes bacterium]